MMYKFKEYKEKGIYVNWVVNKVCAQKLREWAKDQGIKNIYESEKMHVTVVYSRKWIDFEPQGILQQKDWIKCKPLKLEWLGDNKNVLVLLLGSQDLQTEFKECIKAGASFDYDEYRPHVTISSDPHIEDIKKLKIPDFAIELDEEKMEPLDLNKKA